MQRRACIASRMVSSSVVSPRQTLRELARVTAKTKPSPSLSGTAHAFTYACASQCAEGLCTSVLFIVVECTYLHPKSDAGSSLMFKFRSGTHGLNELGRHR